MAIVVDHGQGLSTQALMPWYLVQTSVWKSIEYGSNQGWHCLFCAHGIQRQACFAHAGAARPC